MHPQELIGRNIVLLRNLKPAKLKGIESQGMLLAADDGERLGILSVEGESGDRITLPDLDADPRPLLTLKELQEVDLHCENGKAFSGRSPLLCNGRQVMVDRGITGKIK